MKISVTALALASIAYVTPVALIASAGLSQPAAPAQPLPKPRAFVNKYDCSDLSKDPKVCILNKTNFAVVGIDCKSPDGIIMSGSKTNVKLPVGGVEAHSLTIVTFPSCKDGTIIFTLKGGLQRVMSLKGRSTDEMAVLEVPLLDNEQ